MRGPRSRYLAGSRLDQEDQFITTYSNDDAYELMTRYIEFVRSDGREVTGFVMQADPIRNLRFEKVH